MREEVKIVKLEEGTRVNAIVSDVQTFFKFEVHSLVWSASQGFQIKCFLIFFYGCTNT